MSEFNERTQRRRHISGLVLELSMIAVGVFLGAMAEQWREARHQQALARASLENFRREIAANRKSVLDARGYHLMLAKNVNDLANQDATPSFQDFFRKTRYDGLQPVTFDRTAWDLAIATQSLTDLDPKLAYAISRVYTFQNSFQQYEDGFLRGFLSPASFMDLRNARGVVVTMAAYLSDVKGEEASLVKAYDKLLPMIDSALGGPPPGDSTTKAHAAAARSPTLTQAGAGRADSTTKR